MKKNPTQKPLSLPKWGYACRNSPEVHPKRAPDARNAEVLTSELRGETTHLTSVLCEILDYAEG